MKKLTRVLVLMVICAVLVLGSISISYSQQKTSPGGLYNISDYQELTGVEITRFNESPDLAELVEQGKLPPVEERLPEAPPVLEPFEEIGEYGGTIRDCGKSWWPKTYEPLVRCDKDRRELRPNVAKSWEISDEGRIFTFYLRKGMKWSDGEPFTAEDIMFWFEDIICNEELHPVFHPWLEIGGKRGTVEKIDDYTVRFRFQEPYGYFINVVANCDILPYAPKHYLVQFHPKYTPEEELNKIVREEGFDFWYQLFHQKWDWEETVNP